MSTRSMIGYKAKDGKVRAIYCHWDGYPENNGRILINHYTEKAEIDRLLDLGDLSVLGEMPLSDPNGWAKEGPSKPLGSYCIDYNSRGEETKARTFQTAQEAITSYADAWCEYFYIFDEATGEWLVTDSDADSLKPVREAL